MLQDRINDYFKNCEPDLIATLSRLIAVRSVREEPLPGMPFGEGPAKALNLALSIAQELGFATTNVDNYMGTVDLNDRETRLGILCHLDVVGEGNGWSTPPYEATVRDGMLYGRGTSDNKGPAVASLLALKAVRDLGLPLKYNARLILGTDEESGFSDLHYYLERHAPPPFTFSPDGAFPVVNTEKGGFKPTLSKTWAPSQALPRVASAQGGYRINVVPPQAEAQVEGLTVQQLQAYCEAATQETGVAFSLSEVAGTVKILASGEGGHAALPEHANNALTGLLALLASLPLAESESARAIQALHQLFPHGDFYGQALGIAQSDEISGPLTLSFDIFELTPTGFQGRFDSRVPLCATPENCVEIAAAQFSRFGIQMEGKLSPAHHTPCDSPFVQTLLATYEQYTGLEGSCESMGGGTYVHDIPGGVAFGALMPGFSPNMHGADEHISIADLLTAAKIFTQVIAEICGDD